MIYFSEIIRLRTEVLGRVHNFFVDYVKHFIQKQRLYNGILTNFNGKIKCYRNKTNVLVWQNTLRLFSINSS